MEFFGLLLTALGGLIGYGGLTGRSPLEMVVAVASGKPLPAASSWYDLGFPHAETSMGPLNNAGTQAGIAIGGALAGDAGNGGQDLTAAQSTVVNFALAQRGDPYVWDTAGPKTYDCSGLSLAAYAKVGIVLPHLASAQERMGTAVTLAEAQPSDLVFWGPVSGHVAIYIGNGQVVHAPHTGDVVKTSPLWDQNNIRVRRFLAPAKHLSPTPGV